ncbi:MAG: trypsin-like peptidase domain-containing protein [Pirellulales bacterium]
MTTHNRFRRPVSSARAAIVAASLLVAVVISNPAAGQFTDVAIASSSTPATSPSPSLAERDAEYAALAKDVEAYGRELAIVKRVVRLVTPAVVHIEAEPKPQFQGLLKIEEAGSGVIVQFGSKPFVLTNRHVIRHSTPDKIDIHLADGRILHPKTIYGDQETDVAVMAVADSDLPTARLGNSDVLEIGDFVLAVGSPFGLSQSVTRGIVSAKGRHNLNLGDGELMWQNFIQTDAAINPGNSGGPLVNLRGEVVGLNTAIASASGGNEGIGFSIPINIVARTAQALVDSRPVPRGYLGVVLDDNFNERRAANLGLHRLVGTRITGTTPGTPAERADLLANDVIVKFDDITIEDDDHLRTLVKLTEIGKQVQLMIYRNGQPILKMVEIGDLNTAPRQ